MVTSPSSCPDHPSQNHPPIPVTPSTTPLMGGNSVYLSMLSVYTREQGPVYFDHRYTSSHEINPPPPLKWLQTHLWSKPHNSVCTMGLKRNTPALGRVGISVWSLINSKLSHFVCNCFLDWVPGGRSPSPSSAINLAVTSQSHSSLLRLWFPICKMGRWI